MTNGRNIHARLLVAAGAALVLAAATLTLAGPAGAGTEDPLVLVVDTNQDASYDPGDIDGQCDDGPGGACTLREAVLEGTENKAGATITFDASTNGSPIVLVDDLEIDDVLITVTGNGVTNTVIESIQPVEGFYGLSSQGRHFDVGDGELVISSLTLQDGQDESGGSILVTNGGSVVVDAVHFIGNEALEGGAIYADAGQQVETVEVTNSTFVANSADFVGGAIAVGADTATVVNSTFTDNRARAGAAVWGSPFSDVTIDFSTFSGNVVLEPLMQTFRGFGGFGGTINQDDDQPRTITVSNSILEGTSGEGTAECVGPVISAGGNLVDDDSCGFSEAGDLEDTAANAGAVGDNGGPTFTMALGADSPAVDNVAGCELTVDQRGEPRPEDGNDDGTAACDSGAYELAAPADPDPTTTTEPDEDVGDTATEAPAATPTQANPTFTG